MNISSEDIKLHKEMKVACLSEALDVLPLAKTENEESNLQARTL